MTDQQSQPAQSEKQAKQCPYHEKLEKCPMFQAYREKCPQFKKESKCPFLDFQKCPFLKDGMEKCPYLARCCAKE